MKKSLLATTILLATTNIMALDAELTGLADSLDGDTNLLADTLDTVTDTEIGNTTIGETLDAIDSNLGAADLGGIVEAVNNVVSEPTPENIAENGANVILANSGLIDIDVDGEIVPRGTDCNIITTEDTASITFDFGISDFGDEPANPGAQIISFDGCDGDEVRFESSSNTAAINNPALLNVIADNTTADTADDITIALDMLAFTDGSDVNLFDEAVQLNGEDGASVEPVNVEISVADLGNKFSDAGAIGELSTNTDINVIFE